MRYKLITLQMRYRLMGASVRYKLMGASMALGTNERFNAL